VLIAVAACLVIGLAAPSVLAQVVGDEAEMERLRVKAEEAIANGDPDGASMNSGKAALMAAQLAKQRRADPESAWYQGAESLFRAQEHAYRALALFQRAGGQPPASTGVCSSMQLAKRELQAAEKGLQEGSDTTGKRAVLHSVATEWANTIEGLTNDFQCAASPSRPQD
jgi:hypothetical protein